MGELSMTDLLSDEQIMAQVMLGKRTFLEILVERYHKPLFGYLYRLTNGNCPLAEDLVQETFLRVLQQDTYQPQRLFKPWLYSIATHLAYDYFRSAPARRTVITDEEGFSDFADPQPDPEEIALAMDEGEVIASAICRLGEEYRAALLLRFYQGLSLQEIAQVLQIPLGTVKSRLSVGAARLRDLLADYKKGEKR